MARPKIASRTLLKAEKRAAGIASIDLNLDLGNGLTLSAYNQRIQEFRALIALYNQNLATLDDLGRQLKLAEAGLSQMSEQMLMGTGAKYGTRSREYGQAGGTPKGERRRTPSQNRKNTNPPPNPAPPAPIPPQPVVMLSPNLSNPIYENGGVKNGTNGANGAIV
jgi:hypothetical protein